ncbi:MAG: hypothetical protein ACOY5C_14030 [Pseudomonadota bacterium]|uniref:hypothetical protein n=1 Tax=Thermithiobacillus tepidarius TaxID=929 RepID=UPI000687EDD3|nr:hypothetical protein [Thermithiobacillus tepidarius]
MRNLALFTLTIVLLGGCAYPTSEVKTTDNRASIAVQGAPEDAVLYIDGLSMGRVAHFDGKSKVLLIEPGIHKVEIVNHNKVLLSEKAFLGTGELKTFTMTGVNDNQ